MSSRNPSASRETRRTVMHGRWGIPRDRNAKARIQVYARTMLRATEPGRHYGRITAKHFAVMMALLYRFHDAETGHCFPSHEAIAAAAGCARSTVQLAIKALEEAGIMTWVRRWSRARIRTTDAEGMPVLAHKVVRDSNAYAFVLPPCEVATGVPTNATPSPRPTLRPTVRIASDTEHRSGSEVPSIGRRDPGGHARTDSTAGARGRDIVPPIGGFSEAPDHERTWRGRGPFGGVAA